MRNSSHRFFDLFAIGFSEYRSDAQGATQGKPPIEIVVKADERHHTSVRKPRTHASRRASQAPVSARAVAVIRPVVLRKNSSGACKAAEKALVHLSGGTDVLRFHLAVLSVKSRCHVALQGSVSDYFGSVCGACRSGTCGTLRSKASLVAENLFLRKQLAFYQEHKQRPRLLTDAARLTLVLWSRLFDWKTALLIVKPDTLIGWHRKGFKLFWRRKSRPGRPPLTREVRELITRMARENPNWGQMRVAAELYLKLGIFVSPRTVRKYWPWEKDDRPGRRTSCQHWRTFVRNHADAIVACDFMVAVTANFQWLYVLVILELGWRRILHCNVTAHPTAEWTLQQFRQTLSGEGPHRFIIHDRDSIFSAELDQELTQCFGVRVLKTPPQSPQANAFCGRLIGTMRRECLDFLIPLNQSHLRRSLHEWVRHYNGGRPHSSLGPGIPDQRRNPETLSNITPESLPRGRVVISRPILGGLHHEYGWEKTAA
jgi:putative transposase